jgi:hypothetical protein
MPHVPIVHGVIDRRILINYRVDPDILTRMLPPPFRPKLVKGVGMVGVCLIRLREVRPRFLPAVVGIGSENAAHRIAVEWDDDGQRQEGVYIPRRDTNSRFNTLLGGRLFPGVHQPARFTVTETDDFFAVALESDDHQIHLRVAGHIAAALPASSVFASLEEASAFFQRGSTGYSVTREPNRFDGLELRSRTWHVEPFRIELVESSTFDDRQLFPAGSIQYDCALIMRGIAHEWHAREQINCHAP